MSGASEDGNWRCMPCDRLFPSWESLLQHKAYKQKTGAKNHIHCQICGQDFETEAGKKQHVQQSHPKELNLHCPGCHSGPFPRLASLMDHIENGGCSRIDSSSLNEAREKKLEFTRQLSALTNEPVKNDFARYFTVNEPAESFKTAGTIAVPEPGSSVDWSDFPALPGRANVAGSNDAASHEVGNKSETSTVRDTSSVRLSPDDAVAQYPSSQKLQAATRLKNGSSLVQSMDPDDPDNPSFSAERYYSEIIAQYICPKVRCGKVFKNRGQLVSHLRSPAHGDQSFRCPYCLRMFKSLTAISSHVESSSVNCRIRETDGYNAYLDQLTAGMVDIGIQNEDGTPRYTTKTICHLPNDPKTWALPSTEAPALEDHNLDGELSSIQDKTMSRRCLRTAERTCCVVATYTPLIFVYGLTTWAVWVLVEIGKIAPKRSWLGFGSSAVGISLYILLNWSYTTAVFTDPGSTTNRDGYGLLPTAQGHPPVTSFTVKSTGEIRFCKKCQARKPDRAHHCSTCQRCVLKMDHHCPWLATCLGLRNYKSFLLFLVYTSLFCFYAFAVSGTWVWSEVIQEDVQQFESILPVNFVVLSVLSGIIGIVVGIFTGWHVMLASKGQTTIECLERTRYLSPLRQTYRAAHNPANGLPQAAQQFLDFHTNALPGITRPEEGEERRPSQDSYQPRQTFEGPRVVQQSFEERERQQSRLRYEEYLDEQDSLKLPNAFDLGWKNNLLHVLGPNPWLWALPICNTTGDGWSWEASPRWLEIRNRITQERQEQRAREINAGWGSDDAFIATPNPYASRTPSNRSTNGGIDMGAVRKMPSKADRVLGRDPNLYADGPQPSLRMQRLSNQGKALDNEPLDTDDDDIVTETDGFITMTTTTTTTATTGSTGDRSISHPHESRDDAERLAFQIVSNGRGWSRQGVSGILRKGSPPTRDRDVSSKSSSKPHDDENDDGVD
ncbi:hypothetical protein E4U21_006861 [Claviceps maximensis]|nr:hypothetical protein E4U21_006861 [Claviceps maximensis]